MKLRIVLLSAFYFLAATFCLAQNDRISDDLLKRIEANPNEYVEVLIVLENQYDILNLHQQMNQQKTKLAERQKKVIQVLKAHAAATQPAFIAHLESIDPVAVKRLRTFWITNAVAGWIKGSTLLQIKDWSSLGFIQESAPLELDAYEEAPNEFVGPVVPGGSELGLRVIGADKMWALGYSGYGSLTMTSDTGIDPTHPALKSQYRGMYTDDAQSWYDYAGSDAPFDCAEHGTHVTGTQLGLERSTNDTIGVAFNAHWIGGAVLCGLGTIDNIAAFEWALNPDNNDTTTDDIPDVINNSWHDPGINNQCVNGYIAVLDALEAAGVAVVFSAGNDGPEPSTITNPKNISTSLVNVFSIGALNAGSLTIADFSSRGPSACFSADSSLLIKPEVSAPGVGVRSSIPGGLYSNFNGTSMSCPHVSGAILLLREAFPDLTGEALKLALYNTAIDLGAPGEDNVFGRGLINVYDAYQYLINEGNTPFIPSVTTDVMLLCVEAKPLYCGGLVQLEMHVENQGMTVVNAIDFNIKIGGQTFPYVWNGTLSPNSRLWIRTSDFTMAAGNYSLIVEVSKVNGLADDRVLNNRMVSNIQVTNTVPLQPALVGFTDGQLCTGGKALVDVPFSGAATLFVRWFEAGSNTPFSTEHPTFVGPLSGNTIIETEHFFQQKVGKEVSDIASLQPQDLEENGLVFDVLNPMILRSVNVYSDTTGIRFIRVFDSSGAQIFEKLVNVTVTGGMRVDLNFNMPVGNGYTIVKAGGRSLGTSATALNFPYVVNGIVSIKRSTNGPQNYLYFYDWTVEWNDACGVSAFEVPVSDIGITPQVQFSASSSLIDLNTADTVVAFTNTSMGAETYQWSFGDGTNSTTTSPFHNYGTAGDFQVVLSGKSAENCIGHDTMSIEVLPRITATQDPLLKQNAWKVFPNPAINEVQITSEGLKATSVELYNSLGQQLLKQKVDALNTKISLSSLTSGMYYVLVHGEGAWFVYPVVKL